MAFKFRAGQPIPLIDDPAAPDVFATDATGFVNLGGAIAITFETVKVHHGKMPAEVTRTVIGRVVMPVGGAQALAIGLYNFLTENDLAPKGRGSSPDSATTAVQ